MKFMLAVLCTMSALACTNTQPAPTSPSLPSPPLPPPPTPPPSASFTVSGVVRAAGAPVEGARILVLGEGLPPTVTDANGFYSIAGVPAAVDSMSPLLSAYKAGFFSDVAFANPSYAPIGRDTQLDFNLVPVASIAVGDVVRGHFEGSEPACSHWGYGSGACQRFAVTAPTTGTLELTLTAPVFDFDIDVVAAGEFALYDPFWAPTRRISVSVRAGSTYEIRLVATWCRIREFELTTSMR